MAGRTEGRGCEQMIYTIGRKDAYDDDVKRRRDTLRAKLRDLDDILEQWIEATGRDPLDSTDCHDALHLVSGVYRRAWRASRYEAYRRKAAKQDPDDCPECEETAEGDVCVCCGGGRAPERARQMYYHLLECKFNEHLTMRGAKTVLDDCAECEETMEQMRRERDDWQSVSERVQEALERYLGQMTGEPLWEAVERLGMERDRIRSNLHQRDEWLDKARLRYEDVWRERNRLWATLATSQAIERHHNEIKGRSEDREALRRARIEIADLRRERDAALRRAP